MTKESTYELQKIDCNCNDCKHLSRNIEKGEHSKTLHYLWQRKYFDLLNRKKLEKAEWWLNKKDHSKAQVLLNEINAAKFQFRNTTYIQFGYCGRFEKDVSFIPNVCQLETQNCFEHRRG